MFKRKNPYHPIGSDGLPEVAPNLLDRNFHQGQLRKVRVADITYMPFSEICQRADEYVDYYNRHQGQKWLNWRRLRSIRPRWPHRVSILRGPDQYEVNP
ncbi:MAG: hypothetical protein IJ131_08235 [Eggerthellaceae bacterium]|nr:hypothetical protein [Eggerthellaceae bacterium]